MKHIVNIICILVICFGSLANALEFKIIGGKAASDSLTAPTGVCSGTRTFAMSQVGVLPFTETTSVLVHGVAPLQQSYDGFGYIAINNGAGTDNLYVYNLDTFSVTNTAVLNNAGVPDSGNTFAASHYNSYTDVWTIIGNKPSGGGCGRPNGCVHVRTYGAGSTTALTNTITSTDITASTMAKAQTDNQFTYFVVENLAVKYLHRINTASWISAQNQAQSSVYALLAQDDTYLYAADNVLGVDVVRYSQKSALGTTGTFTYSSANGELSGIVINDGYMYLGVGSDGIQVNKLHKVNMLGFGTVSTLSFLAGEIIKNVLLDSVNQKIYVIINAGGTTKIKRVGIASFTVEETYSGLVSSNGPRGLFAAIDIPHQKIYSPTSGGGGYVTKIEKINLCS